ncbi:hypothetical protein A6A40_17165 (plasmid) [Azospirillum humicireducens]|uniref:LexA repressor DNA-binding domain-containing protein n=1 Tax=Azospirillum humicireducens TaxID=1226968 RepID=A0A2R4VQQ7_9PROT|nr:winged helix DNA-binding protein [Azospirillum humicireducens]AWB06784.1 hypothetical protein A6A40_17165 [Azospirillum humicireducens]
MSKRGFSETVLMVFLHGYAQALAHDGRTPSARRLAERLGYSETSGLYARSECIARGWMEVVQPPHGNSPGILRLTPAGIDAARSTALPTRQSPTPRTPSHPKRDRMQAASAAKIRTCLCCGNGFASEGPGNRICNRCRSTEVYCSGDVSSFRAVLP